MNLDISQETKYDTKPNSLVNVPTVTLDDTIANLKPHESVFLVKIDVQGHEAQVFKGFEKSIKAGKVRNILFEYWVDALDNAADQPSGTCTGVENILLPLVNAGYTLFDTMIQHHPNAQKLSPEVHQTLFPYFRPLNFMDNCMWYVDKGKKTPNYNMGYWTDVLAVYNG